MSYTKAVEALARLRGVTLLTHNVIYKLLELLKVCMCVKSGFIECSSSHPPLITLNVLLPPPPRLQCELESGLPAVWEEEEVGEGVVLKVFQLRGGKAATVGGCRVKRGRFSRSASFRLLREGEVGFGCAQ